MGWADKRPGRVTKTFPILLRVVSRHTHSFVFWLCGFCHRGRSSSAEGDVKKQMHYVCALMYMHYCVTNLQRARACFFPNDGSNEFCDKVLILGN